MAYLELPPKDLNTPLTPAEWNYLVDKLNARRVRDLIDVQDSDPVDKNIIQHNGSGWVYYDINSDYYNKEQINQLLGVVGEPPTGGDSTFYITDGVLIAAVGSEETMRITGDSVTLDVGGKNFVINIKDIDNNFNVEQSFHDGINLGGGRIDWEDEYNAIRTDTGFGFKVKLGTDTVFRIHNATGSTLKKLEVVYPNQTSTNGRSNVSRAISNSHETLTTQLGVICADILDGDDGYVMIQGVLHEVDTTLLAEGSLFLSSTIHGELTNTEPVFPNYRVLLGVVDKIDAIDGEVTIDSSYNLQNDLTGFWNGTVRESFLMDVISDDGINSYVKLYPKGSQPNLTALLSTGRQTITSTPPVNIPLNSGALGTLTDNYVYFKRSNLSIEVSTSGFPNEEHIKLGFFALLSASQVQAGNGVLVAQVFNDHVQSVNGQGHQSHITEKLRGLGATWKTGIDFTATASGASSLIRTTAGKVSQLHLQDFPSFDMALGDHVHVVNSPIQPYLDVLDLNQLNTDSNGGSLSNSSFSIVFWGSQNSAPEPCKMFCNLPSNTYAKNTPQNAVSDAFNYSDYTIPDEFVNTGFLIARVTYVRQANGSWSVYDVQSLKRTVYNGGGGSGGGGIITFLGDVDTPDTYVGAADKSVVVSSGEDGLIFVSRRVLHEQLTASTDWVIPHDLKHKYPTVVATDSTGRTIRGQLDYSVPSQITISFNSVQSGEAELK